MSVQSKIESGVAHIRLTNPKSGNAIGASLLEGITSSLRKAMADETCRAITLSAEGPDFCKGMDIEEAFKDGHTLDITSPKKFLDCLTLIRTSERPVIACVEGNVTGGGVGLVAACDIVLADENVVFMLTEVIIGMIPALIIPILHCRLSSAQVNYMALSTRGIKAKEAMMIGLVDELVEDGMESALNEQLRRLFCSSPRALAEVKKHVQCLTAENLRQQTEMALKEQIRCFNDPDVVEHVRNYVYGCTPPWFQKYRGENNV